ncbi:MAG TPA: hypothetical protein PLJ35_02230 [Anaerolineae bacterium]|nr:hypothetical protein [Anaerolineae bacterium]HOQ97622.1 hypothetical protein [Anaerolineae bacterium]HPL26544.1 hypothetical protein [Anaerolineae bacterium]HPL26565.1 hypothetical protein [Anaerolineae bacterium]
MSWLAFVILSLALYAPPFGLAWRLWSWALRQVWIVPLVRWRCPAGLAAGFWLTAAYLALAALLHLAHRRLPSASWPARLAWRLSGAGLGGLGVLGALAAAAVLLLAWPILPLARAVFGWALAISQPTAGLAGLYLLAEALRMAEDNLWADRAFAAWRRRWLAERGL